MLDGSEFARQHAAELLGRSELGEPPEVAARWLAGRRVFITGAGGSVGRPLAAAIAGAGPARLVLVDHHEASLWDLHRRFADYGETVSLLPADIRDRSRMCEALRSWQPEVVFHLAAYKHVPFGEAFPDEAFRVNVLGTLALLELAGAIGVERFVYPSSDKACKPPSLYGATKRIGEALVRRAARRTRLSYNVARFGHPLEFGQTYQLHRARERSGQADGHRSRYDAVLDRHERGALAAPDGGRAAGRGADAHAGRAAGNRGGRHGSAGLPSPKG